MKKVLFTPMQSQSLVTEQFIPKAIDSSERFTSSLKSLIASIPKSERKEIRIGTATSAILNLCKDDFSDAQTLVDTIGCFESTSIQNELLKLVISIPKKSQGTVSFSDVDRAYSNLFHAGENQRGILSLKLNLPSLVVFLDDPLSNEITDESSKSAKKVQTLILHYVSFQKKNQGSVDSIEARTLCSSLLKFAKTQPELFVLAFDSIQVSSENFLDSVRSLHLLNSAQDESKHLPPVLDSLGVLVGKNLPMKRRGEHVRSKVPSRVTMLLKISAFLDSVDNPDFNKLLLDNPGLLKILLTSYDRIPSEEKLTNALKHLKMLLVQSNDQDTVIMNAQKVFGSSASDFFKNLGWRSFLGLEMIALKKISNYDPESFSQGLRVFFSSKNWGHKTSPSHDDLNRVGDAYLMLSDQWRRNWDFETIPHSHHAQSSAFEIGILGGAALNSFTTHPNASPLRTKFDRMIRAYRGLSYEISRFGVAPQDLMRVLSIVPQRESSANARLDEILLMDMFVDGHSTEEYKAAANIRAYQIRSFILPMIDSGRSDKVFKNSFCATTYELSKKFQKSNGRLPEEFHKQIISLTKQYGINFVDWINDCFAIKECTEKDLIPFIRFCVSSLSELPPEDGLLSANTSSQQVACLFSLWQQAKKSNEEGRYRVFASQLLLQWNDFNIESIMNVLNLPSAEFNSFWDLHHDLLFDAAAKYPKYLPTSVWLSFIENSFSADILEENFSVSDLKTALSLLKGASPITTDEDAQKLTDCLSHVLSQIEPDQIRYFFSIISTLLPDIPSVLFLGDPHSAQSECDALISRFRTASMMGEGTIYSWNLKSPKTFPSTGLHNLEYEALEIKAFPVSFREAYPLKAETQQKIFRELFTSRGQFSRFDPFELGYAQEQFQIELLDAIVQVRQKDLKQQLDSKDEFIVLEAIEELKEICNHTASLLVSRNGDLFSSDSKVLIDSLSYLLNVILVKENLESLDDLLQDEELSEVLELHRRISELRKLRAQSHLGFDSFAFMQPSSVNQNDSRAEDFQRFVNPKAQKEAIRPAILQQLETKYSQSEPRSKNVQSKKEAENKNYDVYALLLELSIRPVKEEELDSLTGKVVEEFHPLFFEDKESAEAFYKSLTEASKREPSQFFTTVMIERQRIFFTSMQIHLKRHMRQNFTDSIVEEQDERIFHVGKKVTRSDSVDGALTNILHLKLSDDLSFFTEANKDRGKLHGYLQLLTYRRMLQVIDPEIDNEDSEQFVFFEKKITDRSRALFNEIIPFYLRSRLPEQGKIISKIGVLGTDSLSKKAVNLLNVSMELQDCYADLLSEDLFGEFSSALDERNQRLRMLLNEVAMSWSIDQTPGVNLFSAQIPSTLFSDDHARDGKKYLGIFFMDKKRPVIIAYSRSFENPLEKLVYSPVGRLMLEGIQ